MIAPPLAGNMLGSANNSFVVAEWSDEGGAFDPPRLIAPPHLHHNDDEAWYVLEGALSIRMGDEIFEVSAGAGVMVPRGTVHTYWNPGPGPARYLLFMTPEILSLIEAIHAMEDRNPQALAAVFAKHNSMLIG